MPGDEASTLTKSDGIVVRLGPDVATGRIGPVLAVLSVLAAVGLLCAVAAARSQVDEFRPVGTEVTVGMAEPTAARQSGVIAPSSIGKTQVSLFLGYVEFDWDPATPGGVPGFGPWLSATATTGRMEN